MGFKELKLPKKGRSANFFADYTVKEEGGKLVVADGWIQAPGRGDEMMGIIQRELQEIAKRRGLPIVHQFEASNLAARKTIKKQSGYKWVGRSSTGDPLYEKEIKP